MMVEEPYEPILICQDYNFVPVTGPFYQEFVIDADISVYRFLNPDDSTRCLFKFDRSELTP